ncbi:hypothetical protein V493_07744 [Pseudogymnoascus sp. VKM F-4281 (FW-2241)]|nr:hypothetical protein V493_07744 [Pseudogymnoascus sp. VKM F-4281 (FW-2241)]
MPLRLHRHALPLAKIIHTRRRRDDRLQRIRKQDKGHLFAGAHERSDGPEADRDVDAGFHVAEELEEGDVDGEEAVLVDFCLVGDEFCA